MGDLHLGLTTEGEGREDEHRRILDFIETRCSGMDFVVNLGDLYDRPNPSPWVIAESLRHASVLGRQTRAGQTMWLVGNHDRPSRGWRHALEPLAASGSRRLRVVSKPSVVPVGGVDFVLVPYVTDWMSRQESYGSAQEWLDDFAGSSLRDCGRDMYVFGHVDVDGSEASDERDIGLRVPRILLDDDRVKHVFLGHVHKHQTVGEMVTIVGSSIAANFGEAGERKFCVEVEI